MLFCNRIYCYIKMYTFIDLSDTYKSNVNSHYQVFYRVFMSLFPCAVVIINGRRK